MGQLVRYSLDPEYMLEYIHWNLEKGNTLSKAVLKHVMFGKGEFFTYLKNGLTESVVNQPRNIHSCRWVSVSLLLSRILS